MILKKYHFRRRATLRYTTPPPCAPLLRNSAWQAAHARPTLVLSELAKALTMLLLPNQQLRKQRTPVKLSLPLTPFPDLSFIKRQMGKKLRLVARA